jgi:predicted TIM-barrel fold metal-dependent hydrolase
MASGVVDSHGHAWARWPSLPPVPDEASRGTAAQLIDEMDNNGVGAALIVCAPIDKNAENQSYLGRAAEQFPGRLYLTGDLDSRWSTTYHRPGALDRLAALTERHEVRAVSHYLGELNDGWLVSSEADALWSKLEAHSLVLSVSATPPWQADLRQVARRHPDLPIICHHLGLVALGSPSADEHARDVLASAAVENLYLKVSGMHYSEPDGWDAPWPLSQRFFRQLLAEYGAKRLCWGSDFPASTRYCTYRQSLEVLCHHGADLTGEDRRELLGGTISRLLKVHTSGSGDEGAPGNMARGGRLAQREAEEER